MNPTPLLPLRRIRRTGISALIVLGGALWTFKPGHCPDKRGRPESSTPTASTGRLGASNPTDVEALAPAERESLWTALDSARRSISSLTEEEASLPGNEGVSAFSYHPAQDISARYTNEGVRFSVGSRDERQVGFEYDDGGAVSELNTAGIRAEIRHGDGVIEWFENRHEGIEHGFTLKNRPASSGGEIELNVRLAGLVAVATADPGTLELHSLDDAPKLRYSGLKAWDADGKELSAAMVPTPEGIQLAVNDRGARYPLTIDPLITNLERELAAPVTGPGEAGDGFGVSVAVDGSIALVGADSDDTPSGKDAGSAYVFANESRKWVFKTLLRPKAAASGDAFGRAVALSNSGAIALIGAPLDDLSTFAVDSGSATIFNRSGTTWTEGPTLTMEGRAKDDHFGEVVALSGTTAVVASSEKSQQQGIVCVYTRSGSSWPIQRMLLPPDTAGGAGARFGRAIAIDGNTLAVGAVMAPGASAKGAVYLYTRTESTWTAQTPLTKDTGGNFGCAVAMSGTGLLVGADMGSEAAPGAAYFYTFGSGVWTQRAKLSSGSSNSADGFGRTVALSLGNAIVGAAKIQVNTGAGVRKGAAYFYSSGESGMKSFGNFGPLGSDATGDKIPVAVDRSTGLVGWTAGSGDAGKPAGVAEVFEVVAGVSVRRSNVLLSAGDNALNNHFGYAVDIDGDTCAIGAATDTTATGTERGSTYVFIRNGTSWDQEAKLSPAGTQNGVHFGAAVALREGVLVAGAPGEGAQTGAAYVYGRLNGHWDLHRRIEGEGTSLASFGASVAIDGEAHTSVIGAPGIGDFDGRAYVFTRSDQLWTQQAMLEEAPSGSPNRFGFSVAIDGSAILVGAPGVDVDAGAAHVFRRNGTEWIHQATLNGTDDRRFGSAVALDGKLALVGAPGPEIPNPSVLVAPPGTSAAHLFARRGDAWQRVARLAPEHPESVYRFGQAIAIDGGVAVVGGYASSGEGLRGGVQVFAREGTAWTRQALFEGKPGIPSFASSLAISGDTVIAGAPDQDMAAPVDKALTLDTGAVSIFRLSGSLLSGPDASLFLVFDADSSGGLSFTEWLAIYAKPPAPAKEKLFAKADADASGEVSLEEFITAKSDPALTRTLEGWTTRAAAFLDLDEVPDGIVTRDEVAAMWAPGTRARSINAFWSRAKGGSGMDLKEWVSAKVLPNFSTYEAAKATRSERAEVAETLDTDADGEISYDEFAGLFERGAQRPIKAAWNAATGTRGHGTPPDALSISQFIEAPKLPKLPAD